MSLFTLRNTKNKKMQFWKFSNIVLLFNPLKHAFFLEFNKLEIWYSGIFGIANYGSELKIHKFKMSDLISLTKLQKVT